MILLDTCAIIWDALAPEKLSEDARAAIKQADAHDALAIADISLWEVSMLIKKGRLEVPGTGANLLTLFLQSRSISVKPISPEIAELSVNFDDQMNSDPADRIIAATALIHNARLVTADRNFLGNGLLDTLW